MKKPYGVVVARKKPTWTGGPMFWNYITGKGRGETIVGQVAKVGPMNYGARLDVGGPYLVYRTTPGAAKKAVEKLYRQA